MEKAEMKGTCGEILNLPDDCVAQAISRTSPRDACRSEAVSSAFRAAATSNDVWERFLPSDYAEILARAVDPIEFATMKHLYFRLCDPILIDGGKMGFFVDRETGAKCFILPARELCIIWGNTPQYWSWEHHPESRFAEVAELINVCWLEIRGKIESRMLSKHTNYSAYLIFKISNTSKGFEHPLQEVSVSVGGHVSKHFVKLVEATDVISMAPPTWPIFRRPRFMQGNFHLQNFTQRPQEDLHEPPNDALVEPQVDQLHVRENVQEPGHDELQAQHEPGEDQTERERKIIGRPQTRPDGWKEIFLGEFYNEEGDDGEFNMALLEIKGGNWKSGLILQGIEIRPKK